MAKDITPPPPGVYESYTHANPSRVVRYAHLRRFEVVRRIVDETRPRSFVDWGAADGFLIDAIFRSRNGASIPEYVAAYEPIAEWAAKLRSKYDNARPATYVFSDIAGLAHDLESRGIKIECLASLEVMEHLPLPERREFYDFC
ncbi:MAG TPA: hypothetical protein VEF03_04610, partial [Candidatus Binataceae bacterium]|nr:hypothetical protein [Candidatus Binataceae bacterium]